MCMPDPFRLVLFFFLWCSVSLASPVIENEQNIVDLGSLTFGEVIDQTVRVKNSGTDILKIKKVRPSCECMTATVITDEAVAGQFAYISFSFDTTKKVKSKFKKYLYIQSNDPNKPLSRITVVGSIKKRAVKEPTTLASSKSSISKDALKREDSLFEILFFYSEDCSSCVKVKMFLGELEKRYQGKIDVLYFNILDEENYAKLIGLEELYGVSENDPMILFVGQKYFSGKDKIMDDLKIYLNELISLKRKVGSKQFKSDFGRSKIIKKFKTFSPLIVLLAGLVDGINPCAFVTVIFLVSFLSFSKKSKKDILVSGVCFVLGVFVSYLLIGLSLREIFNKVINLNFLFEWVYGGTIVVLFGLAVFSLYDAFVYFKYKDAKKISLQLPSKIKQKIHELIRKTVEAKYFLVSVFCAGFLISILESVCTGQVYLPTIMLVMKDPLLKWNSFFYLVLYNIAFIVPLFCVVLVSCFGVIYVTAFSQKNTGIAKILLAVLFVVLAASLIISW